MCVYIHVYIPTKTWSYTGANNDYIETAFDNQCKSKESFCGKQTVTQNQ